MLFTLSVYVLIFNIYSFSKLVLSLEEKRISDSQIGEGSI